MMVVPDMTALRGADPAFKYKFVHPHDPINGVRAHQQRGWEVVMDHKDGPQVAAGATSKPGEPIEWMGHVLMKQPVDEFERVEREGGGTGLGQQYFDLIEQMISDPTAGIDGIARQGGQYAQIVNETKPNRAVSADL